MERTTGLGILKVHDDVIISLAEAALAELDGFAGLVSSGVRDDLNQWLGRGQHSPGITVTSDGSTVFDVDLWVSVYYGTRLASFGRAVVDRIDATMAEALGSRPRQVTIHVEGVQPRD